MKIHAKKIFSIGSVIFFCIVILSDINLLYAFMDQDFSNYRNHVNLFKNWWQPWASGLNFLQGFAVQISIILRMFTLWYVGIKLSDYKRFMGYKYKKDIFFEISFKSLVVTHIIFILTALCLPAWVWLVIVLICVNLMAFILYFLRKKMIDNYYD